MTKIQENEYNPVINLAKQITAKRQEMLWVFFIFFLSDDEYNKKYFVKGGVLTQDWKAADWLQ